MLIGNDSLTRDFGFSVEDGPSDRPYFPTEGPYDARLGYTLVPVMTSRLDSLGFGLTRQARMSAPLLRAIDWGAYPVFPEKSSTGLSVSGRARLPIVSERHPERTYPTFDSIPELLWRSLLYIESQDFLDARYPKRNPAVEWDRFAIAAAELAVRSVGVHRSVPGGSTLATQIEKFRHSPGGLTMAPRDKLRQMFTASLRAYQQGPNTRVGRERIVTDYLNSVPLAAQAGHGEVVGTADGLWAWYGTNFAAANAILRAEPADEAGREDKGTIYRQSLSLLVAHRRPTYFLATAAGRAALADLTDSYLSLLVRDLVLPRWLADEARRARDRVTVLARVPERPPRSFTERKAENLVRTQLLSLTGVPSFYELDRLDLIATSGIDFDWNAETTALLVSMRGDAFLSANGFKEARILQVGDPKKLLYSVTLLERTEEGNVVRVQADNFDGPMSLASAARLELGSTAKLRTLGTYLEIVDEMHRALSPLSADSLRSYPAATPDVLTRWAIDLLLGKPETSLTEMLDAAMERRYSASPAERFVTGGGTQTFSNFDADYDPQTLSVRGAFRNSVNLPFIRLMRDVVRHEMFQGEAARVLEDMSGELRADYLTRFADAEGASFVRRFLPKYASRSGPEIFDALIEERRLGHQRLAWAIRTVAPDMDEAVFKELILRNTPDESLSDRALADLYRRTDPTNQSLSDLGYLARIHPLELWVASYALHHPGAEQAEYLEASRQARVEVYGWLFRTGRRNAQDQRIRSVLEMEAFQRIHRRWARLGYPFESIVPSLGTAIGSSGDRPLALAALAGIIQSGGLRHPTVGITSLTVGEDTPYETHFERRLTPGTRVMTEEVAAALRHAMVDVVEAGTGRRVRGAFVDADGNPFEVGGKTGTGDNRFRVFAAGGRLMESRAVNRTATFVFIAGDRYFGVVVAYVDGPSADAYRFTSALPTQLVKVLAARLRGM